MLSYTFINSHSQVSDPVPKGPLVKFKTIKDIALKLNVFLVANQSLSWKR